MRKLLLFLVALSVGTPAMAADVLVTVTRVRNGRGHVRVAVCTKADFLAPHCPWQAVVKASFDAVHVTLPNVPPGLYAVEAFHDENDNAVLDRNFLGIPTEGMAFSNDARMHFGPPAFEAAAFVVSAPMTAIVAVMRY